MGADRGDKRQARQSGKSGKLTARRRADLAADAAALAARPGVLAVYLGHARVGGRWTKELALVVHVIWKRDARELPPTERLPRTAPRSRHRVDVVETGRYVLCGDNACDASDPVWSLVGPKRFSTMAALRLVDGGALAIVSGHGTLPIASGAYQPIDGSMDVRVQVIDHVRAEPFHGALVAGASGGDVDVALAALDLPADQADELHPCVGRAPPYAVGSIAHGETYVHYSMTRGRLVKGQCTGLPQTPAPFESQDGTHASLVLSGVYPMTGTDEFFAHDGDSGSLVFDDAGAAVGTLVGRNVSSHEAFVLPLQGMSAVLGPAYGNFFSN